MMGAILPPHQTGGTDLNRFIAVAPKIRVLHIITRLDMGGSAQNTLLSCLGLDPALYSVTLVKGSTEESNMTREEVQRLEQRLASAREQGVRVITIPTLVRSDLSRE